MNSKNNKDKGLDTFRKDATPKTRLINDEVYKNIDWDKLKIEKELAKKNIVVNVPLPIVRNENSLIPVWDLKRYAFLLNDKMPHTANPKLWEQGKLNLNSGLFKVTDRIYQVRGFDLANMNLVKGDTGWIVIDCLTSTETAVAAIKIVNEHFGDIPISAVIFTHSHVDHYGGILGVLDSNTKEDSNHSVNPVA